MKKLTEKWISLLILVVCFFVLSASACLILSGRSATSIAITTKNQSVDLSSYRETYVSEDNKGYTSETEEALPFEALTKLAVFSSVSDGFEVDTTKKIPVIKLKNASDFSLKLTCADIGENDEIKNGYRLSSDSWGATQTGKEKQTVSANGASLVTGKIGTGALIVQTSHDGVNFVQSELGKFSNGYYTTDFLSNFKGKEKEIFVPDGRDIKQGVYISTNFFYETSKYLRTDTYYEWWQYVTLFGMIGGPKGRTDVYEFKNVRETYTFFVVEDDVENVTFNNLTTADSSDIVSVEKPSSEDEEEYQAQSEQYNNYLSSVIDRILPTMYSGSMTTTGFRINVTANPYLSVSIKRNGIRYPLPELLRKNGQAYYEISEDGRYDITVASYSKKKEITIFVDNVSANVAYQRYFGDSILYQDKIYGDEFLNYAPGNPYGNMRVFDANSDVPVFAGTLTMNLQAMADSNVLPLSGLVRNVSLGTSFPVEGTKISLTQAGEYEVLFCTNPNDPALPEGDESELSGDVRIYRFRFKLIKNPTGSEINRQLLATGSYSDFSIVAPSDYNPVYYGVARNSADKGLVTVAFSDRNSAIDYARNVVWGMIEEYTESNGNKYWRVPDINNPYGQKVISTSGWENARVINTLSEEMVSQYYFDLSDLSSYLTLSLTETELTESGMELSSLNLASLSLKKSVIIWYSAEQRSKAIASPGCADDGTKILKFIGKQPYATLSDHFTSIVQGERDYRFIHDSLGIDSHRLTATDSQGRTFALNYDDGLYAQLILNDCSSGLIRISEETVYGVSTEYDLCFIEEGCSPAAMTLCADGAEFTVLNSKQDEVTFQTMKIAGIDGLLDPYSFVKVQFSAGTTIDVKYYERSEAIGLNFSESGFYVISVLDRFGNENSYHFSIES